MKILYIDIVSMPEHLVYNRGILRALGRDNEIDICAANSYFRNKECNYRKYFSIPDEYVFAINKPKKNIQIIYRKRTYKAYQWIKKNIPLQNYNVLWFSYTEPITFFLSFNRCKVPIVYCDHLISEVAKSKIKQWFSQRINTSYNLVYFERYIGVYLEKQLKIKNPLYLVRHPLPRIENINLSHVNILFAPANSNDETFVGYLIDNESEIPDDLKIVIRSRIRFYESQKLEVYNQRISDEKYYKIMSSCAGVLIHYGSDYNYRTSTVWFESLVNRKLCYMYSGNTMRTYSEQYPGIVKPFYSNTELLAVLSDWKNDVNNCKQEDFDRALNDYSDEAIYEQVDIVLRSIRENG